MNLKFIGLSLILVLTALCGFGFGGEIFAAGGVVCAGEFRIGPDYGSSGRHAGPGKWRNGFRDDGAGGDRNGKTVAGLVEKIRIYR